MVVDGLVFRVISLVERKRIARILQSNRVISDAGTGSGAAKTHEDGSIEWRVDGGRGKVGGNRHGPCALAPAALCMQF